MDLPTQSQETINALVEQHLLSIDISIGEINKKLDNKYTTKEEHETLQNQVNFIQKIVFGAILLVLLAFMGAIIYMVFPHSSRNVTTTNISTQ